MRVEIRSIRHLLIGAAVLFLATGTARANEFVVILHKDNEKAFCCFCHDGHELCGSFGKSRKK